MEVVVIVVGVVLLVCVMLLYLLAPRLQGPSFAPFLNWKYAHRGLHDMEEYIPENSLAAFGRAVKKGYGIELDVQLTADDQLVVFHDFDLKRMCGVAGLVKELTYKELQDYQLLDTEEKIPLLIQVLDLVAGKVPLIIEIKSEDREVTRLCQLVLEHLQYYRGTYCIESFNSLVLNYLKKYAPDVIRGQLSGNLNGRSGLFYWLLKNFWINYLTRPDFVAYELGYERNIFLRLIKKIFSVPLVAYTTMSQEEYDRQKDFFDCQIFEGFEP